MKSPNIENLEMRIYNRYNFTNSLIAKHEPGSKTGMHNNLKSQFRGELHNDCKSHDSKEIALSLHFESVSKNPPSLHTLVKNYLDLMHKPMPDVDGYSRILFADDSQIRYLSATQYISDSSNPQNQSDALICDDDGKSSTGHVYLKSIDFPFFIEIASDAKIIRGSIGRDIYRDQIHRNGIDSYIEAKKNFKENSAFFGEKGAESLLEVNRLHAQQQFMNDLSITDDIVFNLLEPDIGLQTDHWSDSIGELAKISLNNFYISETKIEVNKIPRKEGDSKIFKNSIRLELQKYKTRFGILFPLIMPTSIFIVYTPPVGHDKDLDNILLSLFPIIIEEFDPPTRIRYNLKNANSTKAKSLIMKYEALRVLPNKDVPDGAIHIFLRDQIFGDDFWSSCNKTIEQSMRR